MPDALESGRVKIQGYSVSMLSRGWHKADILGSQKAQNFFDAATCAV
jgi:hypothetical protein